MTRGIDLTTEYVRKEIEKMGCELVGEYTPNNKITVICLCGHKRFVEFYAFVRKTDHHLCNKCCPPRGRILMNKDDVIQKIESCGFYILDDSKVRGTKLAVPMVDYDGYKYNLSLNHITMSKYHSFARFHRSNPFTLENMKKWVIENNKSFDVLKYFIKKNNLYVKLICDKCNKKWETSWTLIFTSGRGCPFCNELKGERELGLFFNSNNINFIEQYRFVDCRNKLPLPFDVYLPDYNSTIEYMGQQHYFPVDFGGKGKEWAEKEFKELKIRDAIKEKYCLDNNIPLLKIHYKDFNRIPEILTEYLNL